MDFQNFFEWDQLWQFQEATLWRLIFSFALSAALSWVISALYEKTYRGSGYTQSMNQTIILLSCIVSLIMIVIGSNIARAFSLVGALSIIRFRTAVKSTRDTTYIFLALAIGMACGSRFYATAVAATVLFSILILILHTSEGRFKRPPGQILKMRLPTGKDPDQTVQGVFEKFLQNWELVSFETVQMGSLAEATYQVQLKSHDQKSDFLENLKTLNENQKIILFHPDREISL